VSDAAAQAPSRPLVCGDDGVHRVARRRNALEQAIQSGVTSADSLPDVQAQAAAREALTMTWRCLLTRRAWRWARPS